MCLMFELIFFFSFFSSFKKIPKKNSLHDVRRPERQNIFPAIILTSIFAFTLDISILDVESWHEQRRQASKALYSFLQMAQSI